MKFKDLKNSTHFERDTSADEEIYIPTSHIECGWDGSDFPVYSIELRGGSGEHSDDIIVSAVESDGEQGGFATFPNDTNLKLNVLGIIERL